MEKLIDITGLNVFKEQIKNKLGLSYDTTTSRINIKFGTEILDYIDASPFIVDGMLSDVSIVEQNDKSEEGIFIKFEFNTDSGKSTIYLDSTKLLTDISNQLANNTNSISNINIELNKKALLYNIESVEINTQLPDAAGKYLFHYVGYPCHSVPCGYDGQEYTLVCAYHYYTNTGSSGANYNLGQYFYAFLGNKCVGKWDFNGVPSWVKENFLEFVKKDLQDAIDTKQTAIPGYGLTHNDFTDEFKNKLNSINVASDAEIIALFA